jgi:acyl-CoA reductase-like NAD-dependent aldehyde dehydrogenase
MSDSEGRLYIGGQWVEPSSTEWLVSINPATEQESGRVPAANAEDVDRAVAAARQAFDHGPWPRMSVEERADVLRSAAAYLREHTEEIAKVITAEMGSPIAQSLGVQVPRAYQIWEYFAELGKTFQWTERRDAYDVVNQASEIVIEHQPIGVVAAIVPWNFPTALLANKLGPALVAGNCVVAKPAETTPLTTLRIAQLMSEAGLPDGVFNVVTGLGSEGGEALVAHPRVGKVAFTGSTATGRRIMSLAADGVKRLTLELGGSDPMIVCDDADIDAAVSAASVGRFFNCGQACLAVKRLYLFESIADDFIDKLIGKVVKLRIGPGRMSGVVLGPLHTERGRALIEEQVEDATSSGAKLLHGGRRPDGAGLAHGFFYEPTVLIDPPTEARVATEEVFGPVLPVWRVADLGEAITLANSSAFGLGSSVWTADLDRASRAAHALDAGYTWINSPQKIYDELPFGGLKQSGFGKEHGMEALDHYMDSKSVVYKSLSVEG